MVRLVRNTMNFVDLCRGEFGRKVAYTGVDRITPQNVVKVVSDTIGIHNRNRTLIDYLYRYMKGDQPILYRSWTDLWGTNPICMQKEKCRQKNK